MSAAAATRTPPAEGDRRIVRTLTFQADPARVLEAWCDLGVQQAVLAGAARCRGGDALESQWEVHAPMNQRFDVVLRRLDASPGLVRHRVEGEHGLRLDAVLEARALADRSGTEATLLLDYQVEGVVAQVLARLLDPAPRLLAGNALRRVRAWLEAGEVPTLDRNPSAREPAAHDAPTG